MTVVRGTVTSRQDLPRVFGDIRYSCTDSLTHVDVPWAARYESVDDSILTVQPAPSASPEIVGEYLAGFVLPLLLRRKPLVALHGSAVSDDGRAIVIVGTQGSGKSTTAVALRDSGRRLLCDDVVPIATGPTVLPGVPWAKLLPDAYRRLVGDPDAAPDRFDGVDKYRLVADEPLEPARLACVVSLEIGQVREVSLTRLRGAAKIAAIVSHLAAAADNRDAAAQLVRCSNWLSETRVFRLVRPEGGDTLDEVKSAILSLEDGGTE
jgi:hypothetical protein